MPRLAGLTEMTALEGWFGKHPLHGDFVSRGLSDALRDALQKGLDAALVALRDMTGAEWEGRFDAAPPVRFWLGDAILGCTLAGVMVPSQDSVGRRYPLVTLAIGDDLPPPLNPDQGQHMALEQAAGELRAGGVVAAGGLSLAAAPTDLLWAINEDGEVETLIADIAAEDFRRAARDRSYWWVGDGGARMISVSGLPDGMMLGWVTGLTEAAYEQV